MKKLMLDLMPSIFIGHGNPMNALMQNTYTDSWVAIGHNMPKPEAILAISAHWYLPGTAVTSNLLPPTIHDFGGFPDELFNFNYPAPGSPTLAQRVQELLTPLAVKQEKSWGLDHGTWSVLCHIFPKADIPVVQLSIDATASLQFHYDLGKRLAILREEGVLIMGSGNIVHNLRRYAWGKADAPAFDWAMRFEDQVRALLKNGDDESLVHYDKLGSDAMLSVPTPEHYLPLLYIMGTRHKDEPISFPVEGFEGGAISMLSVKIG
ncbi:MAG: 4,5-DOPA-extradiol-dioxygenase [Methylophilaceae bacterium]